MKKFTKSILLTAALGFNLSVNAAHFQDQILLSAKMNGAHEIPAVITDAIGVASLTLNSTRDTLCLNMTVTGLSGPITGAHVHSGDTSTNGPVVFDFTSNLVGNSATATITGADLTPSILAEYLHGMMYVNVHTAANPNGEIRGQIMPEMDMQYTAMLDGMQEVPSVITSAWGMGSFLLSKHNEKMIIRIVADSLSGAITGAHFHTGDSGVVGPVAIDLTANIMGNTILATIDPTPILADLMAGNIYINLHTAANPDGEIRGQLMMNHMISFDAWLDGDQETPPVITTAAGLANISLNTTMDTLWYDIIMTGLTDPATGAHLHSGIVGVAGGVVYDMSADISGNMISGMATGATITPLLSDMLMGNIYVNIHNTTFPDGEIRGQVYRFIREGYTATINGSQEVPAVASPATGTLVASIDREQSDLHFMVVADSLTVTGVHFHNAPEGQNGGVVFDITPMFMNNGAFGYWKSTDASPFTTANSLMFRNDSIYINLHTAANANGEIRGQAERGFMCYTLFTGINETNSIINAVTLFPNPAIDKLNIIFNGNVSQSGMLVISDLTGRTISGEEVQIRTGENKLTIDVNTLTSGIYMVSLKTKDASSVIGRFTRN